MDSHHVLTSIVAVLLFLGISVHTWPLQDIMSSGLPPWGSDGESDLEDEQEAPAAPAAPAEVHAQGTDDKGLAPDSSKDPCRGSCLVVSG